MKRRNKKIGSGMIGMKDDVKFGWEMVWVGGGRWIFGIVGAWGEGFRCG